jgi:pimeloyl-ACP methyl ester carboxylesterase
MMVAAKSGVIAPFAGPVMLSRYAPPTTGAAPVLRRPQARRPCCAVRAAAATAVQRSFHVTPDGVRLELLRSSPLTPRATRPALLFVHGSYHGAWCWAENWLQHFSALGYEAVAVSLRGHGGSDAPAQGAVAGTLSSHAADVLDVAATLDSVVVLGHSFGGLVAQRSVTSIRPDVKLAGLALLCSVPPEGNGGIAGRMLRSTPLQALRVTWAFISRAFETDLALCRDTFFSAALDEAALRRYQAAMRGNGKTRMLDLKQLNDDLPVPKPAWRVPFFVMGAELDAVVDAQGVRDAAQWAGVTPVFVPACGHDVMLDAGWRNAAGELQRWLDTAVAQ